MQNQQVPKNQLALKSPSDATP